MRMRGCAAAIALFAGPAIGEITLGLDGKTTTDGYRAGLREKSARVLLVAPPPKYPKLADITRDQGCVRLKFLIRKDGKTDKFEVLDSKPRGKYNNSAIYAVYQWEYEPADHDEWAEMVFTFEDTEAGSPNPPDCSGAGAP